MHQTTGNTVTGFLLALTTAVLWGILPVALKVLLDVLTANTITWVRFFAAAVIVGIWLALAGKLPRLSLLKRKSIILLMLISVMGLLSNYILYLAGLNYLTPETGQLVIQLAPFLMMIGGLLIFRERLLFWQKVGAVALLAGLLLFFNDKLYALLTQTSSESLGILLVIIAAFTWAAYALAQKQLLVHYRSEQIMFLLYSAGAVCFLPFTELSPLATHFSMLHWGLLIFCCLNTVVAYGAFAEALQHWEASKVSAILAVTPLLTIVFTNIIAWKYPLFIQAQVLNIISLGGACLVVAGSAMTALAPSFATMKEKRKARKLQRDVF